METDSQVKQTTIHLLLDCLWVLPLAVAQRLLTLQTVHIASPARQQLQTEQHLPQGKFTFATFVLVD